MTVAAGVVNVLADRGIEGLIGHMERHIGSPETVYHELVPMDLHIDVHVIAPTPARDWHTLVTTGMSERAMKAPFFMRGLRFAELMVCLPPDWKLTSEGEDEEGDYGWPVSLLQAIARAPHDYGFCIGDGHTIPNGDPPEPFSDDVDFRCVLFRTPSTAPPEFATARLGRKMVRFYGVVPLYLDEMEFALNGPGGHQEPMQRLDAAGVTELLRAERPSVCTGQA